MDSPYVAELMSTSVYDNVSEEVKWPIMVCRPIQLARFSVVDDLSGEFDSQRTDSSPVTPEDYAAYMLGVCETRYVIHKLLSRLNILFNGPSKPEACWS